MLAVCKKRIHTMMKMSAIEKSNERNAEENIIPENFIHQFRPRLQFADYFKFPDKTITFIKNILDIEVESCAK